LRRYGHAVATDERVPGRVFGEVAEDFDRVRLTYPADLVDDVLSYVGPRDAGRRALEVGAGTGKATLAFAARGVPILALEPDHAMAAVLSRHVADLPAVQVVRSTFEQYRLEERFGLLYAADAWHWTQPQVRWQLAGQALAPGAVLALFWNNDRIDDPAQRQAMLDVLAEFAPTIVVRDEPPEQEHLFHQWPGNELAERHEFEDLVARIYRSRCTVSGRDYLTRMSTRSQWRMQAQTTRQQLIAALTDVFDHDVSLTIDTVLYLARRTTATEV
jgi:trans-aconitate methyltransferase